MLVLFTILRLVIPLLILKRPLFGALFAVALDSLDWTFVPHSTEEELLRYQQWDKILDVYYLTLEAYILLSWTNAPVRRTGIALYILRLVGVVFFITAGSKIPLFLFPNLFESFFVFVLLFERFSGRSFVPNRAQLATVIAAIAIPKVIQEYAFHVNPVFPWDYAGLFSNSSGIIKDLVNRAIWIAAYLALPLTILIKFIHKKT